MEITVNKNQQPKELTVRVLVTTGEETDLNQQASRVVKKFKIRLEQNIKLVKKEATVNEHHLERIEDSIVESSESIEKKTWLELIVHDYFIVIEQKNEDIEGKPVKYHTVAY